MFKSMLLPCSLLLTSWYGFVFFLFYYRQKRRWWCATRGCDANPFQTRQEEEGDYTGQGWSCGWTRTRDTHTGSPDSRRPGTNGHDQSAKSEFCGSPVVGWTSSSFLSLLIYFDRWQHCIKVETHTICPTKARAQRTAPRHTGTVCAVILIPPPPRRPQLLNASASVSVHPVEISVEMLCFSMWAVRCWI